MTFFSTLQRHCRSWRYALPSLLLGSTAVFFALESASGHAEYSNGTQTLVFLRHAEKPAGGLGQLNCQGFNRAIELSEMLPERFGKADYVFAANPSRHVEEGANDDRYSYIRPLMTISPAAIRLGLPVNIDFSANDTAALADELLDTKYHNATVYTAWSHGYLPELINAVAAQASGSPLTITDDWASGDFDSLYVLTLTWTNGKASLISRNYKQNLDNRVTSCPT